MMLTGDPAHDAYMRDMEYEQWLQTRPICSVCGERIEDEKAVKIKGAYICMGCVSDNTEYLEG